MITGAEKRQVFDLPEPRLEVTEHQAMIYCCACCRGQTTAGFPEGVISTAQYGRRVRAAAVYLNVQQLIPEDRVAQAMADLFGAARLRPDSVVAWGKRKAEEFGAVAARIAALVAQAAVRHLDETGFRVAGKGQWLHTALYRGADLVSGVGQTRRFAQGPSRRRHRPRSFRALLQVACRQARAVQRPSFARAPGAHRHRKGAMGRANARSSHRGDTAPCAPPRPKARPRSRRSFCVP